MNWSGYVSTMIIGAGLSRGSAQQIDANEDERPNRGGVHNHRVTCRALRQDREQNEQCEEEVSESTRAFTRPSSAFRPTQHDTSTEPRQMLQPDNQSDGNDSCRHHE